jgi:PAS domain S-box-containing protein
MVLKAALRPKEKMKRYPKNMADIILRALEYTTDGIILGDAAGTVFYHNKAWLRIHALDESLDLRGKKIRDFERPELMPILDKVTRELRKHGHYTYQMGTVRRDGKYHDVHITANVIREVSPPVTVVLLREVTDIVQMQKELARRNVELELLNSVHSAIMGGRTRKVIIRRMLKLFKDFIGVKCAGFYLIDHEKKDAALIEAIGLPPAVRKRVLHIPLSDNAFSRISNSRRTFVLEESMPGHDGGKPDIRKTMGIKRTIGTVFRTGTNRDYMAIFGFQEAEAIDPDIRRFFDSAGHRFGAALERIELLEALEKRERDLHDLTVRLIESGEEEKRQCSRMLHDELGQSLTALKLELETLEKDLVPLKACTRKSLERIRKRIRVVSEGTRSLSKSLHPAMLEELGLGETITWYIDNFIRSRTLEVDFAETGFDEDLPASVSLALYRVAQEALTNVVRHAGASKATISLVKGYPHAIMEIEDNGKGLSRKKGKIPSKGLGLVSMRERVELLGGTFVISSSPGKGTRIRVKIPVEAKRG